MAHIDLAALQQRLAQQQPKPATPVPAEPPSWSTRPAPAGTLRATTTMRAALPLKAPNARAERADERARANALRAQIDALKAEMAEERQRADRLNKQVEALLAEVVRAEKRAEAVVGRAERAEAGRDAERARADALRTTIEELKAEQALVTVMHARELAVAQHDAPGGTAGGRGAPAGRGRAEGEGADGAAQGGVARGVKRPVAAPYCQPVGCPGRRYMHDRIGLGRIFQSDDRPMTVVQPARAIGAFPRGPSRSRADVSLSGQNSGKGQRCRNLRTLLTRP